VPRKPISGFVVCYNGEATVETCLRSIRFVDELIVIDKSSTDATATIAARYADKLIKVPWSPTADETRIAALDACSHDFIVFLDDDECLSGAAIRTVRDELPNMAADVFYLPFHNYVLGRFDPRAFYWPSKEPRVFRRGALDFMPVILGGQRILSERIHNLPLDSPAFIHHFSHETVDVWFEKTNRYTSEPARDSFFPRHVPLDLMAHERLAHWLDGGKRRNPRSPIGRVVRLLKKLPRRKPSMDEEYRVAVATLRACYDIIDRLKTWESESGIDGAREFATACRQLEAEYDELERTTGIRTRA
jgi:glycosyltransferase involved in cell wall biosynthesis